MHDVRAEMPAPFPRLLLASADHYCAGEENAFDASG